jgi:hypothetical protein
MSNPGKSRQSTVSADPVLDEKVTAINPDLDAVAEEGHDAMSWC